MRFGSRGPSELSAVGLGYVTEMASEDAVQGLTKQAQRLGDSCLPACANANTSESNFLSSFTVTLIGVEFSSWKVW